MKSIYPLSMLWILFLVAMTQTVNGDNQIQLIEIIRQLITASVYLGSIIMFVKSNKE